VTLAEAPTFRVVARDTRPIVAIVDRATGAMRGTIVDVVHDYGVVAVARDVIYRWLWEIVMPSPGRAISANTDLCAHEDDGRVLWRFPVTELGVQQLVALEQRVKR